MVTPNLQPLHFLPPVGIREHSSTARSFTTSLTAPELRRQKQAFRRDEALILETVRLLHDSDLNNNSRSNLSTFLRPGIKQILLATSTAVSNWASTSNTHSLSNSKFSTSRAPAQDASSTFVTTFPNPTTMSTRDAYLAYLRPSIIHILRASGFHAARPAALDSLVDITARYLEVLAVRTAESAHLTSNSTIPSITDARAALEYVGALKPSMGAAEEQLYGDDDLRGVASLVNWVDSAQAKQIRRVAGLEAAATSTMSAPAGPDIAAPVSVALPGDELLGKEDYLVRLKKKHSKTGDEERFRGTMLGGDLPAQKRMIEGGGPTSIKAWRAKMMGEEIVEDDQEDTESG